jgi:hypothetical protein
MVAGVGENESKSDFQREVAFDRRLFFKSFIPNFWCDCLSVAGDYGRKIPE